MPVVRRTRATFRRAEFGFFGVVVYTRVHTPRRCGDRRRAGLFVLLRGRSRPFLTNCWMVGMAFFSRALVFASASGWGGGPRKSRTLGGPAQVPPGCRDPFSGPPVKQQQPR